MNPLEELAKKQKAGVTITPAGTVTVPTIKIEDWIVAIRNKVIKAQKPKKSSICALFVGHPKTGKTGVAMDCRSDKDKIDNKKVVAFELNGDDGCGTCRKEHHNNDENIVVLNPREGCQIRDEKTGKTHPDYIKMMEALKDYILFYSMEENLVDVKAIIFDGLDIFLSEICESQMRVDEHLDVAGGVSPRYWKKRNQYYSEVLNLLFDIDVDKYFITHYSPKRRDENTGEFSDERYPSKLDPTMVLSCQKSTPDKMHQIVEFTDLSKVERGILKVKIIATVISDRRNLSSHMKEILIAEIGSDGKIKWTGQAILEKMV